jgi:hypothetical protein
MKEKKRIALFCFLADLGVSIWSYKEIQNYDEYLKIVKPIINSPDFQVQLYALILQTVIFTIIFFLLFHIVIYVLYLKDVKYARKYMRFYTFLAAISAAIMMFSGVIIAIFPLIAYAYSFISVGKELKSLAIKKA